MHIFAVQQGFIEQLRESRATVNQPFMWDTIYVTGITDLFYTNEKQIETID